MYFFLHKTGTILNTLFVLHLKNVYWVPCSLVEILARMLYQLLSQEFCNKLPTVLQRRKDRCFLERGGMGGEAQQGEHKYIHMADSRCCAAETNRTL